MGGVSPSVNLPAQLGLPGHFTGLWHLWHGHSTALEKGAGQT